MNTELPPHQEFLEFAEKLAEQSRAMLLQAGKTAPEVEIKPDDSFVTTTDKAVEARLREMITDTWPDHGIFGEEVTAQLPQGIIFLPQASLCDSLTL